MASPSGHLNQLSTTSCASSIHGRPATVSRPPLVGSSMGASVRAETQPSPGPRRQRWSESPELTVSEAEEVRASKRTLIPEARGRPAVRDEEQQALVFDRMYDHLMREEEGFVGELERFLEAHETLKFRKSKQLNNEWESEVFEPCQLEIAAAVDRRSVRDVSNRHAGLMQEYLDTSNKKGVYGVFRDIVIESEYDPLAAQTNTIKYDGRLRHDPVKRELRKREVQKAAERPEFLRAVPGRGAPVPRMSVRLWDHLESTPYGRMVVQPPQSRPYALHNRVQPNEFEMPRGEAGRQALMRELPLGKRCFEHARRPFPGT